MKQKCDECGERHEVCPECGSRSFTPHEADDTNRQLTTPITQWARTAADGATMRFTDVCWDCGHEDPRKLTLETLDEREGW